MKITRRDALTLLNSCFSKEIFESTCALESRGFEEMIMIARMQLMTAITLNLNNSIWQQFLIDPVKFVETYKHSDVLKNFTHNVLTDFLTKVPFKYANNHVPEHNNTTQVRESISTPEGTLPIDSFYDFWSTCCDIANIQIEMRNNLKYNFAKLDAFIYFNALTRLYGEDFSIWKKELLSSQVEIHTWNELVESTGLKESSSIEDLLDSGIESDFFKCTLFIDIMSRDIPMTNSSPTANANKYLEAMLFYPTSTIVKDTTTTILVEQTNAIHIINSDKNFWGSEWIDADPNRELQKITNYIEKNNQNLNEIFSTRPEDQVPEPYRIATIDNSLIKPIGNGKYSPLMPLEKMLDEWTIKYFIKYKTNLKPYISQFREVIVHPNNGVHAGKPYSNKSWTDAINSIPWDEYSKENEDF